MKVSDLKKYQGKEVVVSFNFKGKPLVCVGKLSKIPTNPNGSLILSTAKITNELTVKNRMSIPLKSIETCTLFIPTARFNPTASYPNR